MIAVDADGVQDGFALDGEEVDADALPVADDDFGLADQGAGESGFLGDGENPATAWNR